MSVTGEFQRYLAEMIRQIELSGENTELRNLLAAVDASGERPLAERATQASQALEKFGLAQGETAENCPPLANYLPQTLEAANNLLEIARIVLGR